MNKCNSPSQKYRRIITPHNHIEKIAEAEQNSNLLQNYIGEFRNKFPEDILSYFKLFRPRLLLQLHKYPFIEISNDSEIIDTEVVSLADDLRKLYHNRNKELGILDESENLDDTKIIVLSADEAYFIHTHYHYILSARKGVAHLALVNRHGEILGITTYSENDLHHLDDTLSNNVNREQILVLSRLIVFEGAPANTATHLLGKTRKWLNDYLPDFSFVISYLDPNVGFRGTTYQAFNAIVLTEETKQRYLYKNGTYVTDRELIKQFGTADIKKLNSMGSNLITSSVMPLLPLKVYCWTLKKSISSNLSSDLNTKFCSPSKLTGSS